MAQKKEIFIHFGSHSEVKVTLETEDVETKIKMEPQHDDGTFLTIGAKDQKEFLHDLQQLLMRYYI